MTTSSQLIPETLPTRPRLTLTHILPALTVLIILISAAIYFDFRATAFENNYGIILAQQLLPESPISSVVQQSAFRQQNVLPVYGSSEIYITITPYRAFYFFDYHPTGFEVFDIARKATTSLIMAQDLASVGAMIKGKKVVISFTPSMFTSQQVASDAYANNFSRIYADGLIFNPNLSMKVRREAAARMSAYPDTLKTDPLLDFAVNNLAVNSPLNDTLYTVIFPLGQIDNYILRLQDHYSIWAANQAQQSKPKRVKPAQGKINWDAEIANAQALQIQTTTTNPYGIDDDVWINHPHMGGFELRAPGSQDAIYLSSLQNSKEWEDFDILLQVLQELGAKPLILSRPINGAVYTAAGISSKVQPVFYDLLQKAVQPYKFPVVDFREHTNDLYFSVDFASHTSGKGWLFVDQVLDAFYHDRLGK